MELVMMQERARTSATVAALANAFDATGVRIREAPRTVGHVGAALKAAGAA
jgi:hypothetical protein